MEHPVLEALADGELMPGSHFRFRRHTLTMRPTAWRLLKTMWKAGGVPVSIRSASPVIWARKPPSTNAALRTTGFRANDALHRSGCPLRVSLRHHYMLLLQHDRPSSRLKNQRRE